MEFQNAYFKIHVWNDKVHSFTYLVYMYSYMYKIIVLYQSCFKYAPGMKYKMTPLSWLQCYIELSS